MQLLKIPQHIERVGLEPDEFISFLNEAHEAALAMFDLQRSLLPIDDRIAHEIKLTKIHHLIALLEMENIPS